LLKKQHLSLCLILILSSCSTKDKPELNFNGISELEITIDTLQMSKMEALRLEALKAGVITKSTKTKFPCIIMYGDQVFGAKIRFKGDWTDHISGKKWSYRIELKNRTLLGKKTFSVQKPSTRGYGQEWLIHQLFKYNQVLTTDYKFVPVRINGKLLGLYAFEEHFEKQLLQSQNRPESVILKYDESLFWECRIMEKKGNAPGYFPLFEATEVIPFNRKKNSRKKKLKEQLKLGLGLMECYRSFSPEVNEYLDLDKFAQFYAILTIANSWHGAVWHNQRMYVNPETKRLEPIGFDVYSQGETTVDTCVVFGKIMATNNRWPIVEVSRYYEQFLFSKESFRELYFKHLRRISDREYLSSFFTHIHSEIDSINSLMRVEYPEMLVDTSLLQNNAILIQHDTDRFKSWFNSESSKISPDTTNYRSNMKAEVSELIPIRVYQEAPRRYTIENVGGKVITPVGYRIKKVEKLTLFKEPKSIGTSHWQRNRLEIVIVPKLKELVFSIEGDTTLKTVAITPWRAPTTFCGSKPTSDVLNQTYGHKK
jgi:hypothetical protein